MNRKAPTHGSLKGRRSGSLARSTIPTTYDKIDDLVEVWFNSGSTHAFVLEDPDHFPAWRASGGPSTAAKIR